MNAEKVVERIYRAYGTDSGCLFGLRPEQRRIVEVIIKATLDCVEEEER